MALSMYRSLSNSRHLNTRYRCDCSGYWFPHRRTGGACIYGPRSDYYHALRQGLDQAEAMALLSVNQLERMFPLE